MNVRTLLLLTLFTELNAYKYLIISPLFGHSHTNFLGKIADTLTDAGHDVTVLMEVFDNTLLDRKGVKSTKKVILHPIDPRVDELMSELRVALFSDIWTMGTDVMAMLQIGKNMSRMFSYGCENVINDEELWKQLLAEKFDVGIAEPFNICGLGMFEAMKIPYISAMSTVQLDYASMAIGEPIAPSYVPAFMSSKGPKMGIFERIKNGFSTIMGTYFFTGTYKAEHKVLKKRYGDDFPSYDDILAKMSYLLTNSNPLLNYPRPIIAKTIDIGGITVPDAKAAREELKEWDAVLNKSKYTVYVSFGSVAKSKDMPEAFKHNLLAVFKSMPTVTFIWKYEDPTDMADNLDNVYISKWLPQNALLADSRLSAFVTHGGLGSTIEVSYLGKPAICVPLFAEQPRNAAMLAQHGGAIVLEKKDLHNINTIKNAIHTILFDESYAINARKLSEMLLNAPTSPKETLIKHAEFVAKFGTISQLDPYGRHLSFFEYYFLDVALLVFVVLFTVYKIVVAVFQKLCSLCGKKEKKE